jgi:flagellum-specific peptidoglycan hydrolase FlgJ
MFRQASKFLLGPILALAAAGGVLLLDTAAANAATTSTIKVSGKLKVRSAPNNSSAVIRQLKNKTKVTLDCHVNGQYVKGAVRKTAQWDHIAGTAQWISHAYVLTTASIPVCAPPPAATRAGPSAPVPAGPTGTMTNAQFLAASVAPAQQSQREFGVPASVTLAQAILESGWGRSRLAANDRNFFGMKCFTQGGYANGCHTYVTSECTPAPASVCYTTSASFRAYASATNSFRDHGSLLATASRYRNAFNYKTNPVQFAVEIQKGGYATDPLYATKLAKVMTDYNLQRYDLH